MKIVYMFVGKHNTNTLDSKSII